MIKEGDAMKIFFKDGALRIFAESFGKVVTLDGTGYYAEEINFHTPSEHKINGKQMDMEMKIIHRAKTVGDFGKRLTLSFLFKGKPGVYNKFLDKLDFYNLPNPYDKVQELREDIYIPNIFMDENLDGTTDMQPFSFYSYEGSLTEPPCNEKTIVYVASEPINVSMSTLQLFREALSMPDQMDQFGRVVSSPKNLSNNRKIMPQNGRAIFHYDKKNDCPLFKRVPKKEPKQKGHYEKVNKKAVSYFYVEGEKPSGMPNSFVVTDNEALGKRDDE
jgi:carbonic anhydrase